MAAITMPGLWFSAQRAVRWTFVALSYATYPVGLVVSCVVLVCVYFGVVTPIGIVARLFGHDPLASRFAPGQPTYWQPRQPIRDVADYFRQR